MDNKGLVEKLNDSATVNSPTNEFKTWLTKYFIEKGRYEITSKAVKALSDTQYTLHSEFAESPSERNKDKSIYLITENNVKGTAERKIAEEIKNGNALDLYLKGFIKPKKYSWKDASVRKEVVKKLVYILNKDPKEITQEDINENGISGLAHYYRGCHYLALKEAGLADFEPWEMKKTPNIIFQSNETRIKAVKWLVNKLNKGIKDITQEDFYNNGLIGLISHYKNSPYLALKEAGFADFEPWEMKTTPTKTFKVKDNRIRAVKWLVNKLNKGIKEIINEDFNNNGLAGLIIWYYKSSPYFALKEAGLANFEPWEMKITPREIFRSKENRIRAVKWLITKSNKCPKTIIGTDFYNNGLTGLIAHYYKGSPYLALKEAGLTNFEPWEMKTAPMNTFKVKDNRIRAVKWLVKITGKSPSEINVEDFNNNSLGGLFVSYYRGSPYLALKEAGLVSKTSDMKHKPCYIKE